MEDKLFELFIFIFKDRGSYEIWRVIINRLIEDNGGFKDRVGKIFGFGVFWSIFSGLVISFFDLISFMLVFYIIIFVIFNFMFVFFKD